MNIFPFRHVQKYYSIPNLDGEEQAQSQLESGDTHGVSPLSSRFWKFSTFSLLFVLLIVTWRYIALMRGESYSNGFATDYGPLTSLIKVKKVVFGGTLRYTDSGHLYMDKGAENIEYFGHPSPEIDQAWKNLIQNEYLMEISEEDAKLIGGKIDEHPVAGYRMIPDFIHSLHCVNHMRMILDSEYYFNASLADLRRIDRIHIHHCLNHIRQLIQCNVDLTPVTSIYMPSVNTFVGNFEQTHTCRDMSQVQEWISKERGSRNHFDKHYDSGKTPGSTGKEVPGQGYDLNDDALMPWNWIQSEYE